MSQPDESVAAASASSQAVEDEKNPDTTSGRGTENRPLAPTIPIAYHTGSNAFFQQCSPTGAYGGLFPPPLSSPGSAGGCAAAVTPVSGLECPRTAFEKESQGPSTQVPDALAAALRGRSRVSQDLRSLQQLEGEAQRCRMALDALSSQKKQCKKQIEGLDEQYDLYLARLDQLAGAIQRIHDQYIKFQ